MASRNSRACVSPFWPVVASMTSSVSVTRPAPFSATRRTLRNSSIRFDFVCRRPAVSAITNSMPRADARSTPSKITELGSPPSAPRTTFRSRTLRPGRQLLGGRGTERVTGGQQNGTAVGDLLVGELADRGRLADTVHPDEHPHVRAPGLTGDEGERTLRVLEAFGHLGLQGIEQLLRLRDLLRRDPAAARRAAAGSRRRRRRRAAAPLRGRRTCRR